MVEKERFGGQITITSEVVNYQGVLAFVGYAPATSLVADVATLAATPSVAGGNMSVPCLVVDDGGDERVSLSKRGLSEISRSWGRRAEGLVGLLAPRIGGAPHLSCDAAVQARPAVPSRHHLHTC
ncbi:hypothetical protein [Olsenella sp. Marseille-P4559]|uniref:hypothetical protein n=1 Tax=Olsenella sp. Marseille-P4559 TaxID=2364795 RepID=UPI001F5F2C00|nr:hypothetical protein [Olsenella sp. Marseille-P4559]